MHAHSRAASRCRSSSSPRPTYHVLQSRGHATATVFNDELLYAKLSQAIAAGHGLSIRGEHIFFPAPLSSLVQSPAWLLGSMPNAYAAAKLLNAAVMSGAVFPAYWLRAGRCPSYAILTACRRDDTRARLPRLSHVGGARLPGVPRLWRCSCARSGTVRAMAIAVPFVCLLAVATRVQFLALPLAYLAAVAVCGRGDYRRHLVPAAVTAAFVAVVVGVPGALGQYGEATHLGHAPARSRTGPSTTGRSCRLPRPRDRSRRGLRTGLLLIRPERKGSSPRRNLDRLHDAVPRTGGPDFRR